MIRDKYLTQEAYDRGYDHIPQIQHNARMWQDNLVAMYQRNQYLKSNGMMDEFNQNPVKVIDKMLNDYIDQLQHKYSEQVEIDTELFEDIKLMQIDMFAFKKSAPYPIVSPSFPILTTDHTLDYGAKMTKGSK
ncbi:hypothetical protein GF406_09530 [candidate division KSB1 bacterium]|nr:hypothetical protein [candidate division KSB1 bacterium]